MLLVIKNFITLYMYIYLYMYVCICVYIYICVFLWVCTHMLCICVCVYMLVYVCMHKWIGMSLCASLLVPLCVCAFVRACSKHPWGESLMDAVYAGPCPQPGYKLHVVSNHYCRRFRGPKYTRL